LNKCCSLKSGMAIRHKDDLAMTDVERFAALYNQSLSTLKVNSYNKPDHLPDDLVELKQFIEDKMDTLTK